MTLTPRAENSLENLQLDTLRKRLEALGGSGSGSKPVLVARLEAMLQSRGVLTNKAMLRDVSPVLTGLLASGDRIELPTDSLEAIKLLLGALCLGINSIKPRIKNENAIDLLLLADSLEVADITQAAAAVANREYSCLWAQTRWLVPLWAACTRHETPNPHNSDWDDMRRSVVSSITDEISSARKTAALGLGQLSYEQLLSLCAALPLDRAVDSDTEEFKLCVANAATFESGSSFETGIHTTIATNSDSQSFSWEAHIYPKGLQSHKLDVFVFDENRHENENRPMHRVTWWFEVAETRSDKCAGELMSGTADCSLCGMSPTPEPDADGALNVTIKMQLAKSTARRDALLCWAHGNGMPSEHSSEISLLQFLAAKFSINQVRT